MALRKHPAFVFRAECGQASLLVLGLLAVLVAGTLILFGFGQALGARSKHQRAADLAAVSGAQVMSRHYQRLFEPAVFENGLPNPRHLSNEEYLALARAAALRGARRNGVPVARVEVEFPAGGFAPTRIEVSTSGEARVSLGQGEAAGADSRRGERYGGDRARPQRGLWHAHARLWGRLRGPAGLPDGQADAPRRGRRV